MANVQRGAGFHDGSTRAESRLQELLELSIRHAVASDLQVLFGVARIVHVVGRIGKHKISGIASHQALDISLHRGVAAK